MADIFTTIVSVGLLGFFMQYLPTIIFYGIVILGAYFTQKIVTKYLKKLEVEYGSKYGIQFNSGFIKFVIYFITGFVLLVNIPGISKEAINILSLMIGAIVAFSSSSIIANAMGGIMILLMKPYKIGDIVRLSDYFGEVAEIKLIYTLIETDKRELITIPNSKIINDVLVNYSKDQHIVSSDVRIEYKVDRYTVEKHLLKAALAVDLMKPFVLIMKLDPHAIVYEVRGILKNVGEIITIRSDLNKAIIDEFDGAKIQIMSPERLRLKMADKKEKDIPNVKIKQMSKKYIQKEALIQEKIMFGRAEQIKEELAKEERLKEAILREEQKIKVMQKKKSKDINKEKKKENSKITKLIDQEKKRQKLEKF